jgi:hypothetical protein
LTWTEIDGSSAGAPPHHHDGSHAICKGEWVETKRIPASNQASSQPVRGDTGDGARRTAKLRPCAATFVLSHPPPPPLPAPGAPARRPISLVPPPPPPPLPSHLSGGGARALLLRSSLNPPPLLPLASSQTPASQNQQPRPGRRQADRLIGVDRVEGRRQRATGPSPAPRRKNFLSRIMPSCPRGRSAKGSFFPPSAPQPSPLARIYSTSSAISGCSSNPTLLVPRSATDPRQDKARHGHRACLAAVVVGRFI